MNEELKLAAIAAMFEEAARQIQTNLQPEDASMLLKEIQKGIDALENISTE